MRQPFSVNKLAKQHNRDSRTCVHWYFVKHFSKLSYHFFSRSKGCISNELRVFFKYILQDHAKTCQLFSQKVPSQIFAPSFFCLIDLLFFQLPLCLVSPSPVLFLFHVLNHYMFLLNLFILLQFATFLIFIVTILLVYYFVYISAKLIISFITNL